MSIFQVQGIRKSYGGLVAVNDVSLDVESGEILGLIGPNGSGKTTLLNVMSGFIMPDTGGIWLDNTNITGVKPGSLAKQGLLRMFQMTRVFTRMSCIDNLLTVGLSMGLDEQEAELRAHALLDELTLDHVKYMNASQLSGGQRKLLEFGMCFIVPPVIALLDEPFAAVHPVMREVMATFITERHRKGQTFVLVSHDMPVIVQLCDRTVCMNNGRVIATGRTRDVLSSHAVMEAYLGNSDTQEVPHG